MNEFHTFGWISHLRMNFANNIAGSSHHVLRLQFPQFFRFSKNHRACQELIWRAVIKIIIGPLRRLKTKTFQQLSTYLEKQPKSCVHQTHAVNRRYPHQTEVPNKALKLELQSAGLGRKKIAFGNTDGPMEMKKKLEEIYPKLRAGGGFVLLATSLCLYLLLLIGILYVISELTQVWDRL